jgi:hypothetical protein
MSTSLLDHAFGIRGYEYVRTDYQDGQVIFAIQQEPETCRCSVCGARKVQSLSDPLSEISWRCVVGPHFGFLDFAIGIFLAFALGPPPAV